MGGGGPNPLTPPSRSAHALRRSLPVYAYNFFSPHFLIQQLLQFHRNLTENCLEQAKEGIKIVRQEIKTQLK